ncbi:hypothetical protein ACNHKD_10145 [Methylocystis sp. JAN1]|uniref:hypothetical protein n=1 Tax=Methylocystis sp. JAN1 TaxID=3397211 RepID=UPI003FA2C322
MSLSNSKIVPAAFWVGFLALGFATSLGGPDKHRVEHIARPAKMPVATQSVIAETEKPAALKVGVQGPTQD